MKTIDIVGNNYHGSFTRVRIANRAIIIENGLILLSHEIKNDLWMLPGGGLEEGETIFEGVVREVIEETGNIIKPSDPVLQIDEYYGDEKYTSYYFFGVIIGQSEKHLTTSEAENGLECRWISIDEAFKIFSNYQDSSFFEEKRGLYLREYTALKELIK